MAGVALLLLLLIVYAARKVIAREVLTGWLRAHGVAAQADVTGLSLGAIAGQVRVGDPKAPDFVAGEASVAYGLRDFRFEVRSVTLKGPALRARLHDGKLSLGALDPLIEELRRRPPQPDTAQPRIRIERGVLLLTTDYGPVRLAADATVEGGRLAVLDARTDAARLKSPSFDIAIGPTAAHLRTTGAQVALTLEAPVQRLQAGEFSAADARLSLTATAPYPDLKRRRVEGAVSLRTNLAGARLGLAGDSLETVQAVASFQGRAAGGVEDLALTGQAIADAGSAGAVVRGARLTAVRLNARADDLRWNRQGGDAVSVTPRADLLAQRLDAGDLQLSQVSLQARGAAAWRAGKLSAALAGAAAARGSWRGLGPAKAADAPDLVSVKRAARAFRLSAPSVGVTWDGGLQKFALPKPVELLADSGARLTLNNRGAAPIAGPDGGALRLAVRSGGLPALDVDVRRLRIAGGGVVAEGAAKAVGGIGPAQDATVEVSGTLRAAEGAIRFTADRCAPVSARKIELGANDVEGLSGRLCPAGGPLFTLVKGDWRLSGEAAGVAAEVPFLQARVVSGTGRVTAGQASGRLGVTVDLREAQVADTAAQRRFNPLRMAGTAALADARWTAGLNVATPAGQALALADLRHDTRDGRGGLSFDTGPLVFTEHGLQPAPLSPMAGALASPVEGRAEFAGHVDWTPDGATSGGTLTVPGLDFQSAAGKVSGLKGSVVFSNLAPLTAAPGQTLSAQSIAAIVPITNVIAAVGLDDKALTITGGQAAVGGGLARIETLSVPLAADAPMTGVVTLDGVQLHDLVEASPFGDRVELDARVSGRVPFESRDGKVRIPQAELRAIQPGRLSIARQALSSIAAGPPPTPTAAGAAAPAPPTDTFTDFAYQAMENLTFDTLTAKVASREDGRLGVLAHIVGRHDPPKRQEIRLSIFDLIGRKFLDRPLPLPSDTGVDLTLDTTLNLDDLLADYADFRQLRGSPPVQPAGPTTTPKPPETPR